MTDGIREFYGVTKLVIGALNALSRHPVYPLRLCTMVPMYHIGCLKCLFTPCLQFYQVVVHNFIFTLLCQIGCSECLFTFVLVQFYQVVVHNFHFHFSCQIDVQNVSLHPVLYFDQMVVHYFIFTFLCQVGCSECFFHICFGAVLSSGGARFHFQFFVSNRMFKMSLYILFCILIKCWCTISFSLSPEIV